MPRLFPILLALALGAQPIGEAVLYLWYFLDNTSFEQAFCDNLDKPELQCHGKCHLTEIAEAPTPVPIPERGVLPEPVQLESCLPPFCGAPVRNNWLTTNANTWPYLLPPGSDWRNELLKPPALLI